MKNYYKILNIPESANNEDIKKAYRQAALFWHPDKNKSLNAHDKFIEANEAYNILIDASKRIIYNQLYVSFYKSKQEIAVFRETKKEYKIYEQWVDLERVKAEKLAKISSDEILTDAFHFIDKYGWLLLLIIGVFIFLILNLFLKK